MNDYLSKFNALLVQLTDDERDEAVEFYREYLLDAAIANYDDCVAELGTPKQLARKVLADYSIRFNENLNANTSKRQKSQATVRTIWLIVLALLSTPITIPALIAILAVFFALAVTVFAFVIAAGAILIGVTILAFAMLTAGIGIFGQSLWVALFYLGSGLVIIGAELLVLPLFIWLISVILQGIAKIVQNLYHRFVKKNRAERGGHHHAKDN
ncbi:DUF1700 domain-containing protein [Lactiplantibacillus plantarum]|uniref:DUF1700 domain-containing protein n=1 Tax=Lactiplantibacillus plantarum TaxID=1590 RepID=UPI001D0649FD|nr:DUF1700 domain-containing protein [Lactiplantibacillus plantarum]MCB7139717.1 DUF1700 domain-containing protein [Lactiplantibacillus plantarum]MCB7150640.1 DUF1700 domain-containing protein [Lactiplantibacillus plantarum]MCB7157303.1 DUF1700 domain-containing protein [Lactiplantibacillus plantarum]MCB7164167.1 DUF1700 domain-containing protein [Lactiplantibacillus plantarum]MCB7168325.1 DUF1700 domain-containing protein [Lactiplantibacillus plantarum]